MPSPVVCSQNIDLRPEMDAVRDSFINLEGALNVFMRRVDQIRQAPAMESLDGDLALIEDYLHDLHRINCHDEL